MFSYFMISFIKPTKAFNELLASDKYFTYSFIYILFPIVGYTLMYIFLTIGQGAPSVLTPWLNITKESYYSVNRFLLAPSMLMSWLLASSVMQIMSKLFKGEGTFEKTMSILALCISVSMIPALLHDLPMSFLSALKIINAKEHEIAMNEPTVWRSLLWFFYSVYFIYFFVLFPKAVSIVHKISKAKSIFIGILSFVVFQTVFLLFNR
ncbi:MAG: YIP1 family protein [Bacteroidetes bacterium]|nr:YIP1 family protein [Bacteroidota bacterium]